MTEAELLRKTRLFLGQQDDLSVFRNETATLLPVNTYDVRRVIAFIRQGQKQLALEELNKWLSRGMVACGLCRGSSDLIGIYKPTGRFFALELKAPQGKLEEEQALFLALIVKMGGFAAVARSMLEVREALERLRRGESG